MGRLSRMCFKTLHCFSPYVNDLMTDKFSLEDQNPACPDFGRSGVMKKQSLRFKTTWAFLSFPAAKRNRWCREKNAESTQRIAEEGWMMLVIGAELTTMLWIRGRTFHVKLKRMMPPLKNKTKINLFIFLAEFGAQAFAPSALRRFTLPLIVGMFVHWLQHARQKR